MDYLRLKHLIPERRLSKKKLREIYNDISEYTKSDDCATIYNYTGPYLELIPDLIKYYPEIFGTKRFIENLIKKEKQTIQDIDEQIRDKGVEKLNPKLIELLIKYCNNYIAPEEQTEINTNNCQIIIKRV